MAYKDKAQDTRYKNDFAAKAYDRVALVVPKGDKAAIQQAARDAGQSVNGYIVQAIQRRMEQEQGKKG